MSGPLFRMEVFLIRSGSKLCLLLPKNKIHPHSEVTQSALMSELGNEAGSYFFLSHRRCASEAEPNFLDL